MSTVEIKKSLIKKTITNLNADITRKGTWAYQNALALESVMSSDKYINDKVQEAKKSVSISNEAKKAVIKNTKLEKYSKDLPNRCSENQYLKELSNGELIFFNRSSNEKFIFISRDEGTTWEVLFNKNVLSQNARVSGFETANFDIEFINGHYIMAWSGTNVSSEKLFVGTIISGEIEEIEEILTGSVTLTDITLSSDKAGRTIVVYKKNKVLYISLKRNTGVWDLVEINQSTSDETWYSRNFYIDEDGYFYLVQATDSHFAIAKVNLSDQGSVPSVSFFYENTGEGMSNENKFLVVWKENTVLIVRYGKNALIFNTKDREFIDTNFTLGLINECVSINDDFVIVVGRNYSKDLGNTWNNLPLNRTYIQTSLSNLYPNASTYRNYIVSSIGDNSTTTVPHIIIKVDDLINNDEIIL